MKRVLYIICAVLMMGMLLSSCAKEIIMDAEEKPVIVVECVLSEEPVQTLKMMFAKGALMDEVMPIEGAEAVLINVTANREVGKFERKDEMTWTLDYQALERYLYRLEVRVPGYDLVWAEQNMPDRPRIKSDFENITVRYKNFDEWKWDFSSSSQDGDEAEYVESGIRFSIHHPYATWIMAFNYNPETGKREMAEQICTDSPYVDNFNLCGTYDPPVRPIRLMRTDYTDPYNHKIDERFFEASLYGNMSGCPLHHRFLRFKVDSKDEEGKLKGTPFFISGSFTGNYFTGSPDNEPHEYYPVKDSDGCLVAYIVSEDYDRFLREAIMELQFAVDTDLANIYTRNNVHSNINGGTGIFGGKIKRILGWWPIYVLHTDSEGYPIVTDHPDEQ